MKSFAFDIALLFLFGLLVVVLSYTPGKKFGIISGEDEKRTVRWARLIALIAFAIAFLIFFIFNNRECLSFIPAFDFSRQCNLSSR